MMKQLTIRKHLFVVVSFISSCMLLVQCSKACNHSNLSPAPSQESKKKSTPPKSLLCIRQSPNNSGLHVEIIVRPPQSGIDLSQCSIIASNLAGSGGLIAATSKVKSKLQYNLPLKEEVKLDKLYLSKGNAVVFKQGKPITLRCMYQTDSATQQGEDHQVQIKVCVYDGSGQVLKQGTKDVHFIITQAFNLHKPLSKPTKKPSSRTSKKSRQIQEMGKVTPADNHSTIPQ